MITIDCVKNCTVPNEKPHMKKILWLAVRDLVMAKLQEHIAELKRLCPFFYDKSVSCTTCFIYLLRIAFIKMFYSNGCISCQVGALCLRILTLICAVVWSYFKNEWMPVIKEWAAAYRVNVFSANCLTSTFAESMNSATGRWFIKPSSSLLDVFTESLRREDHIENVERAKYAEILLDTHGLKGPDPLVGMQPRNITMWHIGCCV